VHVPISDAPCRHRGHHVAGSRNRRAADSAHALRRTPRIDPRDRDRPRAAPCGNDAKDNQDAFRRVTTDRVSPIVDAMSAIWFESAAKLRAPFSPRSRRRVHQHSVRRAPQPASLRRLALRLLVRGDARCVGPTSAISRSSYEHPRLVGSRCVTRLRACAIEEIACVTFRAIRFGGSHVPFFWGRRGGRCLPAVTRVNRTSDTPVASLMMVMPLARACASVRAAKITRLALA